MDTTEQLKKAYLALDKLKSKLSEQQAQANEPIAIVGMGCRFPGGATSPEAYWELLLRGGDAMVEVPSERWDVERYYDPDPGKPGKMYTRRAGFITGVDLFEPEFFGISPREAASMDPQQRLLLEVCWEALENAGIVPASLSESASGVFLGIGQNDYALLELYSGDFQRINTYDGSGNGFCFASGRIAYALGLQGPCLSVDTACSSSLVAVHLACHSLRSRECNLALAGGVQLMLTPDVAMFLSRVGALAPDGRCKTFDAAADGYARGEGCGMVVLKRLSDAVAEGDSVLAVIKGSAVNHGGPSSGLTVPNGVAQQKLLAEALRNAGMAAEDIGYVEAHGTGTVLGDPIEVDALGHVFGSGRPVDRPLYIGSVKTNIGHLETAAGIASLIKTVLALRHGEIPAHLNFTQPNPHIPWEQWNLRVPTSTLPWPAAGGPRSAGVSAFGMSGTNAHLVVQEAPEHVGCAPRTGAPHLLTLSAKTPAALRSLADAYAQRLAAAEENELGDICYTANACRSRFPRRACLVGDKNAMLEQLAQVRAGGERCAALSSISGRPRIAMLFTGQGSQYLGMGRELFHSDEDFRADLEQCDRLLKAENGLSLLELLFGDDAAALTTWAQTALFALQYSLGRWWLRRGVKPDVLLGHSVGEYAAACLAGVFSLEDGIRLIAARNRLINQLAPAGSMAAVMAGADSLRPLLAPHGETLSLAAINGPASCVISGEAQALESVLAQLESQGVRYTPLSVAKGFHSPGMEPVLPAFAEVAARVAYQAPAIPMVSCLTGKAAGQDMARADYWVRHIREPVLFYPAMEELAGMGLNAMLEIGPKPVLLGMGQAFLEQPGLQWLASLRPGQPERHQLLEALGRLYLLGAELDWGVVCAGGHKTSVPSYPWQRRRYWVAGERQQATADSGSSVLRRLAEGDTQSLLEQLADGAPEAERVALAAAVERIAALHRREQQGERLAGLAYVLRWSPAQVFLGGATPGLWLVVGADERQAGFIRQAWPGENLRFAPAGQAALPDGTEPVQGCIYLAGSGSAADQAGRLAAWINALAAKPRSAEARCWIVTQGAVAAGEGEASIDVDQAALWGLGRTLALEKPALWGGLLDLPADGGGLEQAVALIAAGCGEEQLAWRDGAWLAARLQRFGVNGSAAPDADGVYLITGGLGGLGLATANWLAARGARHLLLSGRGAPNEEALRQLQALEQQGVTVHTTRADVASRSEVERLLAQARATGKPLRGVFHAAGSLDDAPLEKQTAGHFQRAMAAKLDGARHLHELTASDPLQWFVLYSSAAGLLGAPGQANYAAANACLDALAQKRRRLGLPALSLDWGAWSQVGMAAKLAERDRERMARQGITPMEPDRALALLEFALSSGEAQLALLDADWRRLALAFPAAGRRAPWRELAGGMDGEPGAAAAETAPALVPRLQGLDADSAKTLIADAVEQQLRQVLQLSADQPLDPWQGFFDMGMDSLTVVELRRKLEQVLGQALPSTLLFDCSSVQAVSEFLFEKCYRPNGSDGVDTPSGKDDAALGRDGVCNPNGYQPGVTAADTPSSTLAAVSAMSEAELEALIDAKLDGL